MNKVGLPLDERTFSRMIEVGDVLVAEERFPTKAGMIERGMNAMIVELNRTNRDECTLMFSDSGHQQYCFDSSIHTLWCSFRLMR